MLLCINSCRMPSSPLGEIKIITRLDTINTGGDCLDLDIDMDIEDSILVAVANYNGYFIYKINSIGGKISDISEQKHIGADEMDISLGDNRAQSVILSKQHNISFVMDQYDHIWIYKYEEGAIQYGPPNYLNEDCYGSTWLSVAIDDQSDRIGIYSLLKHSAAEFMPFCIQETNMSSIGTDQGCSDIQEYIEANLSNQTLCEEQGYNWRYPGCQVGNFAQYSTSLVWKNLEDISSSSTSLNGDPNCEYIINQESVADKIYFSNGFLIQAYGELGIRVYKKSTGNNCYYNNLSVDITDNELCTKHLFSEESINAGDINYSQCCSNDPCTDAYISTHQSNPDCSSDENYINEIGTPGLDGVFSSSGGIIPAIFSEFDTPGKVESIYAKDEIIFVGLSNSNGFLKAILNSDGSITGPYQFAIGYTIKGIDQDDGLLALAAGHDGILLYNLNGDDLSFIGKIETAYANNVKVSGNIIFAATEDGIEIIQIDY